MPSTHVESFLTHQLGKGFSAKTVKRRRSSIARFEKSIHPLPLVRATPELIEEWVHQFGSLNTRHAYRADVVAFFEWARKRKLVKSNPAAATDEIAAPKSLPRPIPTELLPLIIDAAQGDMRVWCALGAYAGFRISEVSALETDAIRRGKTPTITVRNGKGRKDRTIPLHPMLVDLLGPYRRAGRLFDASTDEVGRWGSAHLRACGIDATMHNLRHTFGTELARVTNGNVVLIAALMGHSSIATTMGYIGWAGGPGSDAIGQMFSPDAA